MTQVTREGDCYGSQMNDQPVVIGLQHGVGKRSAVNDRGALRHEQIEGIVFRPARPVPHDHGFMFEVLRSTWTEVTHDVPQVHTTTTYPGRVRAWGLHRLGSDRLTVVSGILSIVCFDGRTASPTFGVVNEFRISDRNPGLLTIPPDVYHGWKNIGVADSVAVNMPTRLYDHDQPDSYDIEYESDLGRGIVPWRW